MCGLLKKYSSPTQVWAKLTAMRCKRFLSEAGEVAYRTTRAVEPFALFAQRLAAGPLPDVLGLDAVSGPAIVIVVVDGRVGRVPRAFALEGTGGLPQAVRSRVQEPFSLVRDHAFSSGRSY